MNTALHRNWLYSLLLLCCFAVAGSGCESVPQPQTVRQGLAYGYTTVTASREESLKLLQEKRISKEEAQMVQRIADACRSALDIADMYQKAGDQTRAQQALTVANESLKQLTLFMEKRRS